MTRQRFAIRLLPVPVLLLILCMLLSGCRLIGEKVTEKGADDSKIMVYYLEADHLTLTTRSYRPKAEHFDGIINELLDVFVSPENAGIVSALPDQAAIDGYTRGADNLTINFTAGYLGLTNIQKALLNAAIVKTLVQIPGVLSISLTVDGQQIRDDDGSALILLNDDSFLDSQGDGLASYRYSTMHLYFAADDGTVIAGEDQEVTYSSNMITEQAVAEEIIAGPESARLRGVASPDTRVNSIKLSNGICYLDMNEAFNQDTETAVSPEAAIYAFVNSICEVGNVYGVRFTIDGSSDVRFRGQLSLDQTFNRDQEIIRKLEMEPQT